VSAAIPPRSNGTASRESSSPSDAGAASGRASLSVDVARAAVVVVGGGAALAGAVVEAVVAGSGVVVVGAGVALAAARSDARCDTNAGRSPRTRA
jgi:hypothetical protein